MFAEVLQDIVEKTPGAQGGIIMGFDGMALDNFAASDMDVETVGMEYSLALKQVAEAGGMLELGNTQEVSVRTETMTTVLRLITDEYFAAVMLDSGGNAGKARFLLRLASEKLRAELE